ncbi:hypothetical protein GCM10007989_04790 [Devosia pacifica]|uniref:EAL domain-containing protein n=1 Tax=Devosia pacifica TaxID=1335967 RepID=A0A918VNV5_9HYPH|nr:EAL domain-containing protein [Devosia pacifica]GHA13250.1 hypothetical protein GCM10007989_04790 [Devosia pacifica]
MRDLARSIDKYDLDSSSGNDLVQRALSTIRKHLNMEVAYLSRIEGDKTVFQRVDAPGLEAVIQPGQSMPLDAVYCGHILEGRLPQLMPDTADFPSAREMPITQQVPIGSHVSIPIRRPNGEPYGMFCCLSRKANGSLNDRDLDTMRMFADLAAEVVIAEEERDHVHNTARERIAALLARGSFYPVFQPIIELDTGRPVFFEALTRFDAEPMRTPDQWFKEAEAVGMGIALEAETMRSALNGLETLPMTARLSLNVSPAALHDPEIVELLANNRLERVMVEVTEHAIVEDYLTLIEALSKLRARGAYIAVDDAGAGYSSFQHIVNLQPEIIKLDMNLTRDIDSDTSRRSLASAMVFFANETGARIVAEGVETEAEAATLKTLGIDLAQGYLFSRPLKR